MAEGPANFKEEIEMSLAEDLGTGSLGRSQEQPESPETVECEPRLLNISQRRLRMEAKAPGPSPGHSSWILSGSRPKKGGHQLQMPRMSREQIHCDTHSQEFTGMFQGTRFPYERNPDADIVAEIGLEELSGLEMEVMRRQMQVITGRLRALENRDATWYHKETILFALLMTMCLANLWLWLRQ